MEKRCINSYYLNIFKVYGRRRKKQGLFLGQSVLKMHYVKVFKNVGIENKKYSKFQLLTID